MREFEAAGVASLTIEDTDLPLSYGSSGPSVVSIGEMCGKLEAAVASRRDSEIVIVGRTDTFRIYGINAAIERVRARDICNLGLKAITLNPSRNISLPL